MNINICSVYFVTFFWKLFLQFFDPVFSQLSIVHYSCFLFSSKTMLKNPHFTLRTHLIVAYGWKSMDWVLQETDPKHKSNQQQNDFCSGPVRVLTSNLAWNQTSTEYYRQKSKLKLSFIKMNDADCCAGPIHIYKNVEWLEFIDANGQSNNYYMQGFTYFFQPALYVYMLCAIKIC